MAAATVATGYPKRENLGSLTLISCKFTTLLNTNTWASGITGIVEYWAQAYASGGTQASAGVNVSLSGSTFTFQPGIDSLTVVLFVLARN